MNGCWTKDFGWARWPVWPGGRGTVTPHSVCSWVTNSWALLLCEEREPSVGDLIFCMHRNVHAWWILMNVVVIQILHHLLSWRTPLSWCLALNIFFFLFLLPPPPCTRTDSRPSPPAVYIRISGYTTLHKTKTNLRQAGDELGQAQIIIKL